MSSDHLCIGPCSNLHIGNTFEKHSLDIGTLTPEVNTPTISIDSAPPYPPQHTVVNKALLSDSQPIHSLAVTESQVIKTLIS